MVRSRDTDGALKLLKRITELSVIRRFSLFSSRISRRLAGGFLRCHFQRVSACEEDFTSWSDSVVLYHDDDALIQPGSRIQSMDSADTGARGWRRVPSRLL